MTQYIMGYKVINLVNFLIFKYYLFNYIYIYIYIFLLKPILLAFGDTKLLI